MLGVGVRRGGLVFIVSMPCFLESPCLRFYRLHALVFIVSMLLVFIVLFGFFTTEVGGTIVLTLTIFRWLSIYINWVP